MCTLTFKRRYNFKASFSYETSTNDIKYERIYEKSPFSTIVTIIIIMKMKIKKKWTMKKKNFFYRSNFVVHKKKTKKNL